MSSTARHVCIIVLISVIGFFGIFLAVVPDLVPQFALTIPFFQKMDTGLKSLGSYRVTQFGQEEYPVGTLNQHDTGHEEILSMLELFDPVIRSLRSLDANDTRVKILGVKDKRLTWSGMSLFEAVWVEMNGNYKIVCLMPDLKTMVKDAKTRFFSKLGLSFALLAILLQSMYSIYSVLNPPVYKSKGDQNLFVRTPNKSSINYSSVKFE